MKSVLGRWDGILRPYSQADVESLRGSVHIEHTLARRGAERLWQMLTTESHVPALGAMTGAQAQEMIRAGLKAIYCSGWQVAAGANTAGKSYPDQSIYPVNSVPELVKQINFAFQGADEVEKVDGGVTRDWFAPIVADAEAGFGAIPNAFELMTNLIIAGAAGVHFEDQSSAHKKCGHLGGKVLVTPDSQKDNLTSARLAADVLGVPTVLIARTDANSAKLLTYDIDPVDAPFLTGTRTREGFYGITGGIEHAIARGLAYAPYADLLWCETGKPDRKEAERFAEGIHAKYPGKLLAYNCSPSFNWKKMLTDSEIASFQQDLASMGYKFQFVTLAGFHCQKFAMFELARAYEQSGMSAYAALQAQEFAAVPSGFTAVKHQREARTGFFDRIQQVVTQGRASTTALGESTETEQFGKGEEH